MRHFSFERRSLLVAWLTAAVVLLTAASQSSAEPQAPATQSADRTADEPKADEPLPPALTTYKGREIAPTMTYHGADWLVRRERQEEEDCRRLLAALKVKPGQTVCDLGCGNGFYTMKLANMVGDKGRVLAVDVQPEMLSLLTEAVKKKHIKHVDPVLGTLIDPKLPEGKVDLILLVDVYHEFSHPEHMLKALRKSLAPGGRIALAEFRLEDPNVPIKLLHKMSKQQILKEFEPNGFKLVEQFDDLPWQHLMFFTRDDDPGVKKK